MKRWPASLRIQETEIKTTSKGHFSPTRRSPLVRPQALGNNSTSTHTLLVREHGANPSRKGSSASFTSDRRTYPLTAQPSARGSITGRHQQDECETTLCTAIYGKWFENSRELDTIQKYVNVL